MGVDKSLLVEIVIIIFFIVEIIKKINNIRKLEFSAKKGKFESIALVIAIAIVTSIAVIYSQNIIHYILWGVVIVFCISNILQQGIFRDGIIAINRGKEVYRWNEIKNVVIRKGKDVKITYYCKDGFNQTQRFSLESYEDTVKIFINNGVEYIIKYN